MTKRFFDLVLGTLLALLAAPVVAVLAVVVAVALRTSPFFVQERIGRDGVPFRMIKLRTLPPSAPRYADKYDIAEVAAPAVCRWLRTWHLDELPQLFLVPIGTMSLVGPRPEMAFIHDRMPASFARARVAVRPGCTGLWQVSEACDRLIAEAPEYDLAYLNGRGLALDCWVLWRTALMVLGVGRPVTLATIPLRSVRDASVSTAEVAEELAA